MDNTERQHLEKLLQIYRQRLNVLEEKIALFGPSAPPYLLIEREDVKVDIARTEQKLQGQISNPPPRPPEPAWTLPIGAQPSAEGTLFRVWAADAQRVEVVLFADDGKSTTNTYELEPQPHGYFRGFIKGVFPGARYKYKLDDRGLFPDLASRYQPDGVHHPSQVVDPSVFDWTDQNWRGIALEDLVIYELHVGTATPEGTFDALITRLGAIRELGATAIELMPVADFPGERNWGYDGVCLFAPARDYGGPEGLRRLVDAAHARGLAVILDAVFNHLGPDGNYLSQFSKAYFNPDFVTPWGPALNFDGRNSKPVRDFFAANACYWAREYHLDGLRIDAIHAIQDDKIPHILAEITTRVRGSLPPNRSFLMIAEDENNDPQVVESLDEGGFGVDALWADDFHHQVRVALARDRDGYYKDYSGSITDLATTLRQGWFYTGQYSAHLGKPRGAPCDHVPPPRFVHCIQNHDQVGNRAFGERLNHNIPLDAYRAVSALLLLSPYTPLLWMGQEWAASTPFLYFTNHNPELGRQVTEGRRAEFASFTAFSSEKVPDPQARETFLRSKLRWEERTRTPHAEVLKLYRDLMGLRRQLVAFRKRTRGTFTVIPIGEHALALRQHGIEWH